MSEPRNYEHGAEARRHLIVGHGGKHGVGGTFLRGSVMPPETARHLPDEFIAPASAFVPQQAPAAVAVEEAKPAEAVKVEPPKLVVTRKVSMPTALRDLHQLPKEDLIALAADLGVVIEGEATVKALREALRINIGL